MIRRTGTDRALGIPSALLAVLIAAITLSCADARTRAAAADASELPVYWQAPEFALVDQSGDTLRSAELAGTAWVAHFFFTNCTGVCPLTTARMARLRDSLAAEGLLGDEVRLVSFSVDAARDSVEALRAYARKFGGSPPAEWAFLTGSDPDAIRRMVQRGFRITAVGPGAMAHDSTPGYQVSHSPRILLVDPRGRVRGHYVATEAAAVDALLTDLRQLLASKRNGSGPPGGSVE